MLRGTWPQPSFENGNHGAKLTSSRVVFGHFPNPLESTKGPSRGWGVVTFLAHVSGFIKSLLSSLGVKTRKALLLIISAKLISPQKALASIMGGRVCAEGRDDFGGR